MSFFPYDRDILTSSLWANGTPEAFKVWSYLLLTADPRTGCVGDADPAIALRCGLPLDVTVQALEWLAAPDPHSRTKEHQGRRIERLREGGFRVLNYLKRQAKDYSTPRVQSWRERNRSETAKRVSTVTGTTDTDTDTDPTTPLPPFGGSAADAAPPPMAKRSKHRVTARFATVDMPETREIIRLRHELLGGRADATQPKLEAAVRFLANGFTVADARRIFEAVAAAPKGGKGHAAFCRFENRTFEYALRPATAQKLLDEADASGTPGARPFGDLTFEEQDRLEAQRRPRG